MHPLADPHTALTLHARRHRELMEEAETHRLARMLRRRRGDGVLRAKVRQKRTPDPVGSPSTATP